MSITAACFQAHFTEGLFQNTCCASKLKEYLSYLFFSPTPFSWLLTHSKKDFLLISLIFLFCSFSFCLCVCPPDIYIYIYNILLLGSSVHGISQARILEWVAISFSKGSSQTRDRISISCVYILCGLYANRSIIV